MANRNNPRGLIALKHAGGGTMRLQPNQYRIASGQVGAIFLGDPVKTSGDAAADGGAQILVAAATDRLVGVFQGCEYARADGDPIFSNQWPSATVTNNAEAARAYVSDDPATTYVCQVSGTGLVAANIGQTADLVIGTGNANTGVSAAMVDQTTIGTGTTVHIVDLDNRDDNAFGQYADAVVRISLHERGWPSTAT